MKTIEIDDQTYAYLQKNAIAFIELPGDTFKRLLGLSSNKLSPMSERVEGSSSHFPANNLIMNGELNPQLDQSNISHLKGRVKKPKTNLPELIRAGFLQNGQKLTFQDYRGNQYPEYHVVLSNASLVWENRSYSMSDLAQTLLKKHGYANDFVRGPLFWITEESKSIFDLWKEYSEG